MIENVSTQLTVFHCLCPLPASRKGLRVPLRSALFGEGGSDWRPCFLLLSLHIGRWNTFWFWLFIHGPSLRSNTIILNTKLGLSAPQERFLSCATNISFEQLELEIHSGERSGSVVECLTQDRGAAGTSLHCGPWARHIYPSLVLVQLRKTRPCLTERLLMGRKESNQNLCCLHIPHCWESHVTAQIYMG